MTVYEKVRSYLRENASTSYSPTELGMDLGYQYAAASTSVMRALKKLVDEGLVVRRSGRGSSRVTYQWKKVAA